MGNLYRVSWDMDIYAGTPVLAAQKALSIHRNPDSIATVFHVSDSDGTTVIDLESDGTYEGVWDCPGCGRSGSSDDHIYDDENGLCMDCQKGPS